MATRITRTRSFRLELVEVEHEFTDEPPSLPGMPAVVETDGQDVTDEPRPLAKCSGDYFPWSRSKAGGR